MFVRLVAVLLALGLAACTDTVDMVPLNPQAQATGGPRLHYASGLPFGIMNVTMPDGESLPGTFRIDEALAADGTNFHATASGPRTALTCAGRIVAGHGDAICRSRAGGEYRLPL